MNQSKWNKCICILNSTERGKCIISNATIHRNDHTGLAGCLIHRTFSDYLYSNHSNKAKHISVLRRNGRGKYAISKTTLHVHERKRTQRRTYFSYLELTALTGNNTFCAIPLPEKFYHILILLLLKNILLKHILDLLRNRRRKDFLVRPICLFYCWFSKDCFWLPRHKGVGKVFEFDFTYLLTKL